MLKIKKVKTPSSQGLSRCNTFCPFLNLRCECAWIIKIGNASGSNVKYIFGTRTQLASWPKNTSSASQ